MIRMITQKKFKKINFFNHLLKNRKVIQATREGQINSTMVKIMKISIKTISFYLKQYKKLRPSQKETQEKNNWKKPKVQKMFNYMKSKDPNL